ncbi:hypothetical protein QPK87_01705 [Kamptonema cortianum]|nr:hypothetical protein [Geitlerinema splendidum]MDK3155302.1 hypothetical protein [Kamptonema cortianum]
MITSLVLSYLVTAHAQEPRNYLHRAAPMSRLTEWLSQETGEDVRVTSDLKDVILFVRLTNKTADQTYTYIAKTIDCDWSRVNGVVNFHRSSATVARHLSEMRAERLESVSKLLKQFEPVRFDSVAGKKLIEESVALAKKMQEPSGFNWNENRKIQLRAPDSIVCQEVLLALGAERLAQFAEGERVVFSTHPTRLQLPLPREALTALRNWRANSAILAEARKANSQVDEVDEQVRWQFNVLSSHGYSGQEIAVCDVVLRVSSWGVNIVLHAYDADGEQIGVVGDSFNSYWDPDAPPVIKPNNPHADLNERVTLTPEDKLLIGMASSFDASDQREGQISPDLLKLVASFDIIEPLSFAASETLLKFCEARDQDLVCVPYDYLMFQDYERRTVGEVMGRLTDPRGAIRQEVVDNVLLLAGDSPSMSRMGISTLAKAIQKEGRLTIDSLSAAVFFEPDDARASALLSFGIRLCGFDSSGVYDQSVLPLRVYGLLSPSERRMVKESGWRLPLNSCSPAVRQLIQTYIRNEDINGIDYADMQDDDDVAVNGFEVHPFFSSTRNMEQTVFLANPASQPILVSLSTSEQGRLLELNKYEGGAYTSVISERFLAEKIYWSRKNSNYEPPSLYAPITQSVLDLRLSFGELASKSAKYRAQVSQAGKVRPWEELDAETKKRIEALLSKVQEQMRGVEFIGTGKKQPPPAR